MWKFEVYISQWLRHLEDRHGEISSNMSRIPSGQFFHIEAQKLSKQSRPEIAPPATAVNLSNSTISGYFSIVIIPFYERSATLPLPKLFLRVDAIILS